MLLNSVINEYLYDVVCFWSRGCEFESQLDQHSFQRLTKVTDMRHLSFTNGLTVYVEKQPVAWKVCCVEYWCEKARKQFENWQLWYDLKIVENSVKL